MSGCVDLWRECHQIAAFLESCLTIRLQRSKHCTGPKSELEHEEMFHRHTMSIRYNFSSNTIDTDHMLTSDGNNHNTTTPSVLPPQVLHLPQLNILQQIKLDSHLSLSDKTHRSCLGFGVMMDVGLV